MKQKEKDKKKNHSAAELQAELNGLLEKQFKLGFKHRVTPLANPLELRTVRRDIARVKGWLREKELGARRAS
jgi:large subunit ribosomal protein L29